MASTSVLRPSPWLPARRWVIPAAVLVAVASNTAVALAPPEGGAPAGWGRDLPFDPAPYAFSIWIPIFAASIVFAVFQALPVHRTDARLNAVAWPYVLGQAFATTFAIGVYVDAPTLASAATVAYFGLALVVYLALRVGREHAAPGFRLFVWLPASLTLAWLLVAALLAAAGILAYDTTLDRVLLPAEGWGAVAVATAAAGALWAGFTRRDAAFGLVVVWALIAIAVGQEHAVVRVSALAGAAVSVLGAAAAFRRA